MPIHNADIAAIFEQIADLLDVEGANIYRIRAYRNAARMVKELGTDLKEMARNGENLTQFPGIGDDLAAKIREIAETGKSAALEKLEKEVPPAVTELLKIPGLGPKRVKTLYQELDVHTVEQLQRAILDGRLRQLPGFGAKMEAKIAAAVDIHSQSTARFNRAIAAQYAEPLAAYLRDTPGVKQVVIAGSYRRAMETVGDLDFLAIAEPNSPVMERFMAYDEVAKTLLHGPTRTNVILKCKLQVDLRVLPPDSYGAALQYFTGSKQHNIVIRRLAQERALKINEYGVFKGKKRIAGNTEESVYQAVGLPFIPPELRENRGEIEAAQSGKLPKLIELSDLKGDLHAHSKATDGRNTLMEMARAAREQGFQYLAITEHSRRLTVAHGLNTTRLLQQIEEIDRLNEQLQDITLLKGIEVDILEDGSLDLPDEVLKKLDLVVGAVHSRFDLSRERQTERILRAMDHPHFSIFAHPSGRLINQREPYDVDMSCIIRKAKSRGCFLELDAQPQRLDLIDIYCQIAKAEGVLISIDSDSHSALDFQNLRFGIGQARRGWLEKEDVLNTRPLQQLRPLLQRTM